MNLNRPTNLVTPDRPMKYYKFIINFALILGILSAIFQGFNHLTGEIYREQLGISPEDVYAKFSTLKHIDVIFGILSFVIAAFYITTRTKLVNFKKDALKFLYIACCLNATWTFLYNLCLAIITKEATVFNTSLILEILATGILLVINYNYFSKRVDLFNN